MKIRIEGTPEEVNLLSVFLRQTPGIRMVKESRNFKNRTNDHVRRYFTVERIAPPRVTVVITPEREAGTHGRR